MKKKSELFQIPWDDNATSASLRGKVFPKALREYRVRFEKVRKGKTAISSDGKLGRRSKLGGEPDWIQSPEWPKCSSCKEQMTFIGQIDSLEHDEPHNPHAIDCMSGKQQYMFGDVGMIYVFLCLDCFKTKSVVQCG
jgi:uncharacterized protein YwqG